MNRNLFTDLGVEFLHWKMKRISRNRIRHRYIVIGIALITLAISVPSSSMGQDRPEWWDTIDKGQCTRAQQNLIYGSCTALAGIVGTQTSLLGLLAYAGCDNNLACTMCWPDVSTRPSRCQGIARPDCGLGGTPQVLPSGLYTGTCLERPCGNGMSRRRTGSTYSGTCTCPSESKEMISGRCVSKCSSTQERVNGKCVARCAAGQTRINGQCRENCRKGYGAWSVPGLATGLGPSVPPSSGNCALCGLGTYSTGGPGAQCRMCTGNTIPNAEKSMCIACTGGKVPNAERTACECTLGQISNPQGECTDPLADSFAARMECEDRMMRSSQRIERQRRVICNDTTDDNGRLHQNCRTIWVPVARNLDLEYPEIREQCRRMFPPTIEAE